MSWRGVSIITFYVGCPLKSSATLFYFHKMCLIWLIKQYALTLLVKRQLFCLIFHLAENPSCTNRRSSQTILHIAKAITLNVHTDSSFTV